MLDLERQILNRYDLEIKGILPYRDGYIINTKSGRKFLKKSMHTEERILFVHGAKEHLYKNDLKTIDRYVCTTDGKPYTSYDGGIFTLCDFTEGVECDFDNRNDIAAASKLLAQLHKASRGYEPLEGGAVRSDLGKLPMYFSKRLEEIKKLKKVARRGKNKFDYIFLECVDYFFALGEDAIGRISNNAYVELVEVATIERCFCHHDYTHHNLIFNEGKLHVMNFDFCCYELKIYDLANLLRRKMRKCNWNPKEAKFIFDQYKKVEPLSEKEIYVLKIMLQFPQKLWRVVNKYYNSKRSWSEKSYIAKLQEVIDEIPYHRDFMDSFDTIV